MKTTILITCILALGMSCSAQRDSVKTISKNKMTVSWYYEHERIHIEMSAPTDGWVTVGFNNTSGMKGAYLLMGNVIQDKPSVIEHYTIDSGNYKSLSLLGETPEVKHITGEEDSKGTTLRFSLPISAKSKYQKDLTEGQEYTMIIAYSQDDDFQHHSIMRTSVNVKL